MLDVTRLRLVSIIISVTKRLTEDRSNIQPGGSDPVGMLEALMAEEGADEISRDDQG